MRYIPLASVLVLLLAAATGSSQQAPTTAGVIEGIVLRNDTGAPIGSAQVTLNSQTVLPNVAVAGAAPRIVVQELAGGGGGTLPTVLVAPGGAAGAVPPRPGSFPPVTTGSDGKFSFKDLAPGTYRIAVTANGFVNQQFGQRSSFSQGKPIFLAAGQSMRDANIRMTATGTLSGRVFDENGQAATGAPVQLLRKTYTVQGQNFQVIGTTAADDRGDYRLYGMTPGRYYLVAGTPPGPPRPLGVGGPVANGARYSLMFYPAAAEMEQASLIEVRSGGENTADMRVKRQTQGYRVRGRVVNNTGTTLPLNTNVMLGYRSLNSSGSFSNGRNFDPATNTFDLQNVAPGEYTIQIQVPDTSPVLQSGPLGPEGLAQRQAAQASRPTAQLPIRVVDADIDGLVLTLATGVKASGRFVAEGQPLSAITNLQQLSLVFPPADSRPALGSAPVGLPPSADGNFEVVGLREGEYRVQLRGALPQGFYIKSVQYGGEDILARPFKFSGSGSDSFEVTLRIGASQVEGTVKNAKAQAEVGIQVVLIPGQRGRLLDYKTAITDQNGHFQLSGVTPGEYKVFSWETLDNGSQFDPDFIRQYEQQGLSIRVAESSNQNVEVRMIPAP